MSTLDYALRFRKKKQHEVLAELLDFALTHNAVRPEHREIAFEMIREAVGRLLMRKRCSDGEAHRIRERWGKYLA